MRPNRLRSLSGFLFLVCLVNAVWSVAGSWSINFGGVADYNHGGRRGSAIESSRGYLVVALRRSSFVARGIRPASQPTAAAGRQVLPWSIYATLHIHSQMFVRVLPRLGFTDPPQMLLPGVLILWQTEPWRGEWWTRVIAVNWVLLTVVVGVIPAIGWVRSQTRRHRGLCLVCGYDLRATPDRCPECGTTPEPARPAGFHAHNRGDDA